jgi:hypothetical protein
MSKEETVRDIHIVFLEYWQREWVNGTDVSGKGLFLHQIKGRIGNWP